MPWRMTNGSLWSDYKLPEEGLITRASASAALSSTVPSCPLCARQTVPALGRWPKQEATKLQLVEPDPADFQ